MIVMVKSNFTCWRLVMFKKCVIGLCLVLTTCTAVYAYTEAQANQRGVDATQKKSSAVDIRAEACDGMSLCVTAIANCFTAKQEAENRGYNFGNSQAFRDACIHQEYGYTYYNSGTDYIEDGDDQIVIGDYNWAYGYLMMGYHQWDYAWSDYNSAFINYDYAETYFLIAKTKFAEGPSSDSLDEFTDAINEFNALQ